jgi:hypothetical protein
VLFFAQVLFDQVSVATAVAAAQQPQQQPPSRHPQHETAAQVCVQATAVLRNLAVAEANAALFVQRQGLALRALVSLLQPFQQDAEVLLNVSRCLSKLSMYDSCRQALVLSGAQQGVSGSSSRPSSQGSRAGISDSVGKGTSSGSSPTDKGGSSSSTALSAPHTPVALIARVLMNTQATQPKQWPAGVRLAFALGQLTAYHSQSQPLLAAVPGVLEALPGLVLDLVQYSQQQQSQQQQQQQQQPSQGQPQPAQGQLPPAEDLMTKLLRVLANLAIDRTVGPALAAKQTTADALVAVLTGYEYEAAEELVLNAVAALTNLAFYDSPSNKVGAHRQLGRCTVLAAASLAAQMQFAAAASILFPLCVRVLAFCSLNVCAEFWCSMCDDTATPAIVLLLCPAAAGAAAGCGCAADGPAAAADEQQ